MCLTEKLYDENLKLGAILLFKYVIGMKYLQIRIQEFSYLCYFPMFQSNEN